MRSFLGRDILSLKDFSRDEFFRVFQVADDLRPFARDRRNTDLLKNKTMLTRSEERRVGKECRL